MLRFILISLRSKVSSVQGLVLSQEDAFGSKNVVVAERADWFRQPACQLLLKSIRRREAWRRNGQSGLADLRVEMASARKNMPQ